MSPTPSDDVYEALAYPTGRRSLRDRGIVAPMTTSLPWRYPENAQEIFNWLVFRTPIPGSGVAVIGFKPYSPAQACGQIGNMEQESGCWADAEQLGGAGRGLCQWGEPGRFRPYLITGDEPFDRANQLNYEQMELQGRPGVDDYSHADVMLRQQTNPVAASNVFGVYYEEYGVLGARLIYAQQAFDAFAHIAPPIPAPTPHKDEDMAQMISVVVPPGQPGQVAMENGIVKREISPAELAWRRSLGTPEIPCPADVYNGIPNQ